MLFATAICVGLLAVVHGQCALRTVAFTAALTQDQTIGANSRVLYNKVITNHGNTFDSSSSQFAAPVDGIYVVHIHLLSQLGKEAWLELVRNDEYIISAYGSQNSNYDAAGNSVVLKLKEGDILFTRARKQTDLYGRSDQVYVTFSVHMISTL